MPSAGIILKPTVLFVPVLTERTQGRAKRSIRPQRVVPLMFRKTHPELGDPAAGNGILSRRFFLEGALVVAASGASLSRGSAEPLTVQPWMRVPGPGFAGYGQPSPFEIKVVKVFPPSPNPAGVGASRTPLHMP